MHRSVEAVAGKRGWHALLELGFEHRASRTVLVRRRHVGPLMVQSPFYPEGGVCHAYVLHPPGGVVEGDTLELHVEAGAGSHALVTTPAAGKFYRSSGGESRQSQRLCAAAGATLEWLPAESIMFDGAHCTLETRIDLAPDARLLCWDAWVLGRPACGERFSTGALRQRQELRIDGRVLFVDRLDADADTASRLLDGPWGLDGQPAAATLLAYPGSAVSLRAARDETGSDDGARAAVTLVDGLLVCRVLAAGLLPLRAQLERWWRVLRPHVAGLAPVAPRIWAT